MTEELVALVREKMAGLDSFQDEIRTQLAGVQGQVSKALLVAAQRGAPGVGGGAHGGNSEGVGALVARSEEVKQFMTGRVRGAARVQVPGRVVTKAIIMTGATLQPGVATAPVEALPHEPLGVLDLITSVPLTQGVLQVVRQSAKAAPGAAVQLLQGDVKAEQTISFTTAQVAPETLAAWIPISRQAAQDVPSLTMVVETELLHSVKELEEDQALNGLSTLAVPVAGELTGLNTNATPLTSISTTPLDVIADLLGALIARGVKPTGIVLNPSDALALAKTKTVAGEYLLGSPTAAPGDVLWSVALAVSSKQPAGTVLAGDFRRGCRLWFREDATIEISSEHADFFVRNLLAVRCEERVLLEITQPAYFAKVTLPPPVVETAAQERKK